jgi:hypothetical protein
MPTTPRTFALALAGLVTLAPQAATSDSKLETFLSEDDAVRQLTELIVSENLYPWARRGDCLSLAVEIGTQTAFLIVVRERHELPCGGDLKSAPVVDRFQVARQYKAFWRYDVATDSFVPFAP